MNQVQTFTLTGVAVPKNAVHMLAEISEHFAEHAEVREKADGVVLLSEIGDADITLKDGSLEIVLNCPTQKALDVSRNVVAEHLFFFAGEEPLELTWDQTDEPKPAPNVHIVKVLSSEDVTPHMRRVKVACDDVTPFTGGGLHVRLMVPPIGRKPVWPTMRADGRIGWPEGDDTLLVRIYTIRAVDQEKGHLWIDILQHPSSEHETPGADFALRAEPGQVLALMGPGGGGVPETESLVMVGDETALPAIARIAAELPEAATITAVIEVGDKAEEQPIVSAARLDIRWLHRNSYAPDTRFALAAALSDVLTQNADPDYIWAACEGGEAKEIRALLRQKAHPKNRMYVAAYWQQGKSA